MNNTIKNFGDFTKAVLGSIKTFLPESFEGADISLQTVVKNNDVKLTGLNIRLADTCICPTIYLESFFEEYKKCESLDEVLMKIAEVRVRNEFRESFDMDMIMNFDKARKHIVPRLISRDKNMDTLAGRPHKIIEDLAVTYAIELGSTNDGTMSTAVSNEMMKRWDVTVSEIHAEAIKNLPKIKKGTFQSMSEVMGAMMLKDLTEEYGDEKMAKEMMEQMLPPDEPMFVLSCEDKLNGASQILNKDIMKKVVERIGSDFYVLPSSVHELLLVRNDAGVDPAYLRQMVREVNAAEVQESEQLSDNIYTWSADAGLQIYE